MDTRTVKVTAAAVGPGAICGAWGQGAARIRRATAAAMGPGPVRGAWGSIALGAGVTLKY